MGKESKEVPFEKAMKKLEEIVGNLEEGELSLEEALKQYEEGVGMADTCSKRLSEAEKRVEVLMKTSQGNLQTKPLKSKKKK